MQSRQRVQRETGDTIYHPDLIHRLRRPRYVIFQISTSRDSRIDAIPLQVEEEGRGEWGITRARRKIKPATHSSIFLASCFSSAANKYGRLNRDVFIFFLLFPGAPIKRREEKWFRAFSRSWNCFRFRKFFFFLINGMEGGIIGRTRYIKIGRS